MKEELLKWMYENPKEVTEVSSIISKKILEILAVEALRWGSFLLLTIVFLVLVWYFVRVSLRSQADNVIITYDLSEMKEANILAKREYLLNIEVLKQDLYKQAEEIRREYTENLEDFKEKLVKELNIDSDVLDAYKEFYKIKSLVYQDLEHPDLQKDIVVPIIYNRLNKTYKRLVDFDKTYGYVLPKPIADAFSALTLHCNSAMSKDSIKEARYVSTHTFINSLDNTNNKFRTYLKLA
jgi:hypothetical protein